MQRLRLSALTALLTLAGAAHAGGDTVDFEGLTTGMTVDGQAGWTLVDWFGNGTDAAGFDDFDEEVTDDGTGNTVWRFSNAVAHSEFGIQPFSHRSPLAAGETDSALWNDRGTDNTMPLSPPLPNEFAGSTLFHGGFRFRSTTGTPQPDLALSISPSAKQSAWRNSFISIEDDGSNGFDVFFFETGTEADPFGTGSFPEVASDLSYTEWHRIDIFIEFVDGANMDTTGNDVVEVFVNGSSVYTGTTWESFYRGSNPGGLDPADQPQRQAVNSLMFRSAGDPDDVPGNDGNGFFFDDVVINNQGPGADLSITKTDTQDPVVAGEQVTYTIEVTNDGPSTAQDVNVTDTPPAEFTFDSATGATCTANGTVDCDLGSIISGDTVSFTLTFDIDSSAMGDLVNDVTVDSTTVDPDDSNNEASEDTTVNTEADLSITKTDTQDPIVAGEQVTYSIEVSNNGPSDAQDVEVVDTPPSGFTFDSATGATCTANGTVTCDLGTVAAGDAATFTITFNIDPSVLGTVSNDVTVSSTTTDPDGNNNDASETTTVNDEADMAIAKTGPGSAVPGTSVTFTVDVTNGGPSDARDVDVSEAPPPDYSFDSATAPCGGGFPCDLGTLTPGQTVSFDVTYSIEPGATGDLTNSVSVTTSATDPNGGNDSDSATTTMDSTADLTIAKAADAVQAFEGQTFEYTLTVDNAGPSDATGVVITDNLPAGQALISSTGCAEDPNGVPTCTVGTVPAGSSATVTLTVEVTAAQGQIANTASVDSDADDPTPGNNSASVVVVTVIPIPTLSAWGLATMTVVLMGLGLLAARRRLAR